MIADRARGVLDAVADDVVLKGLDGEGIFGLECLQSPLRHREWIVAELDLAGLLVELVHREVHDPAEAELIPGDEIELLRDLAARRAGEFCRCPSLVADE